MRYALSVLMLTAMSMLSACSNKPAEIDYPLPTPDQWQAVQQEHVVFGHQSVGANLMDGVKELAAEQNISLTITNDTTDRSVVFQHFLIGTNGDPNSKLQAFQQALEGGLAEKATVAEMKFCYLDFPNSVDPTQLAKSYIETMSRLQAQYPQIRFIATTSPLTIVQTGPKAWIKRLLGKLPAGYEANFRRHLFNDALRQHYGDSAALFDLAQVESLNASVDFLYEDQEIEALAPQLSNDGGHLNVRGQRLLAAAWIRHLAQLKSWNHENHP